MDINDFRGAITAITLLAFIGIWVWAWSSRRHAEFERGAQMPLDDDRRPNTRATRAATENDDD